MKTRAAVLYGSNSLKVEEVELDPPKRGEALVRIAAEQTSPITPPLEVL